MIEASEHAERVALEQQERARLRETKRPIIELPYVAGGIDVGSLFTMAGILHQKGIGA